MSGYVQINSLKPGMKGVNVRVRVLEVQGVKNIRTRSGIKTIGRYIVGDRTGRIVLIAWGRKAHTLKEGDTVVLHGAWVTVYRNEVQLNIGRETSIEFNVEPIPRDEIPEVFPVSNTVSEVVRRSDTPSLDRPRKKSRTRFRREKR